MNPVARWARTQLSPADLLPSTPALDCGSASALRRLHLIRFSGRPEMIAEFAGRTVRDKASNCRRHSTPTGGMLSAGARIEKFNDDLPRPGRIEVWGSRHQCSRSPSLAPMIDACDRLLFERPAHHDIADLDPVQELWQRRQESSPRSRPPRSPRRSTENHRLAGARLYPVRACPPTPRSKAAPAKCPSARKLIPEDAAESLFIAFEHSGREQSRPRFRQARSHDR